ncbi:pyridoxal-phosphate dependent enzyme [Nonomuraea jiangxiensis]|uniref:Threonine dehydratase n=1 Tax=Nonomuraea jiangxiensis TaxID=633440 RepID=A0A1G9JU17_9ACTN|nr:pyridoxal-phosphate dependent enzyme [Nonomuraea jiangxiensis]SDL40971.1 threonine dehydratase [Nonomuraea jiangxiensis]
MSETRQVRPPSGDDLDRAWAAVAGRLDPTPLAPTALAPGALLKLESFQPTGSFKVRGAIAALSALPAGVAAVTASAGNHALGMAHAAAATGRKVTVVVAETASPAKVSALRNFPVELVRHGSGFDAAEAHALELAGPGRVYVSAYNDPHVIAGQATIGRELDAQAAGPLTVVCGVGGGGLAAGLGMWAERRGDVRVVGVEAAASRGVSASVAAGRVVTVTVGETLADGLSGNIEPGCVTPSVISGRVRLTSVTEPEVGEAMRWLFTRHGLVAEGAGAVGVAAVLAGKVEIVGRLVVVLSGRNIAPAAYAEAIA